MLLGAPSAVCFWSALPCCCPTMFGILAAMRKTARPALLERNTAMKKTILAALAATFAAVTFAAFDFSTARTIPVLAPTEISAGTTNATTVADVRGLRGTAEVIVYASAASNRTELTATLYATNRTDGGWTKYTERKATTEDTVILRLPFAGIYQPGVLKVEVGSIGAATTASALILSN